MEAPNVIDDVRMAKIWLDEQATDFDALGLRLREVEQAFRSRTGEFSRVPAQPSPSVREAIQSAADEPGHGLLNDTRQTFAE